MSEDDKPASGEEKPTSYPMKYWWLVLVALPVILAAIKIVPDIWPKKSPSSGGSSTITQTGNGTIVTGSSHILNSDLSTKTYVINLAAIEKEYATVKREPLVDEEPLERGVAEK